MKPSNARARVLVGIGAASILAALVLGALVYAQMRTIKATAVRITGDTMPSIYLSGQLQSATLLRYIWLTDYVNQGDERARGELLSEIESGDARIDDTMARYQSLIDVPVDAQLFAKLKSTRKPYDECYLRVLRLSGAGKRDEAMSLIESELIPLRNAFLDAAKAEVVWNKADADDSATAISAAVNLVSSVFLVAMALALGIAGIIIGIRRQLRTELTLRESEERFGEVFEHAPVGICLAWPDGRYTQMNATFCRILGYSREELLLKTWQELCHPDDLAAAVQRKEELWKGPVATAEVERRYIHQNGTTIWCRQRTSMMKARDGSPRYFVAHIEDVTERRAAEETQAFLAAIVENSEDAIIACTPSGIVRAFNRGAEIIFGHSSVEVMGRHMSIFVPPEYAEALEESTRKLLRGESFSQLESWCLHKDGHRFQVSVTGFPVINAAGDAVAISNILRDITESKRTEAALRESGERFRSMADSTPSQMWVTNPEGEVEFINHMYREYSCLSCEEALEGKWRSELHPDDAPGFVAAFEKAIAERAPFAAEARVRRPDGEWRTVGSRGSPRFSPDGRYLGHIGLRADITERKQVEEDRQFQHSLIRAIYEGSPDGILVVNEKGQVASHNKRFFHVWAIPDAEIIGTSQAPLKGSPIRSLLSSALQRVEHPEEFLERLQKLYADPDANDECEVELKDGRTLERYSTALRNEKGRYLARVLFYRDITERKRSEQALRNSEEIFRQLAENIREVFFVMTPLGEAVLYVSPAVEEVWGVSCESLYRDPMSWANAIHPDDQALALSLAARQLQGERVDSEFRILTPDGKEKWIQSRTSPIRDQAGELIRVVGIAEEITVRKRHEMELIRAREAAETVSRELAAQHATLDTERKILRAFIDNVPDLMYVKDLDSRFVIANNAVARWAGMERPDELIGKTDFDICPIELATGFFENEQRVIRTRQPIFDLEEESGIDAAQEVQYSLTTKVPLLDGASRVTGIAGMGRDITARKKIEFALLDSNRQLQEATSRANWLATEAEAANRAKSEFLANMSHEIRTPMNGVMGMNGLLLGTDLTAEQRHYANVVDASAKSLLTVIDDILDFSKVEAGKLEIDDVDFNLHVLTGDFAEIMAERIGEKRLEFICAVAPDVSANLRGDPGRLRQVLLNLASNALKFTHQGEVVVRADLISETDAEVFLRFTVRDTGIGIPVEEQKKLFTSFTQVDASTTRKYGGTGLGLAISKKLVELMGGAIGLESKEGEGSEFWFTVRLAKQLTDPQVDIPKVLLQGTRVLVVDDNATNREVLTAQLQSWGAIVAAVESGSTGLACLRYAAETGSPFQLAVLDMMMPGMDGLAVGRAILADDNLKKIPLVMMTSLGQRGDGHRFKEIGFAAYLIKPVRQSDFYDCLVTVLSGNKQAMASALVTGHSLRAARRGNARILLVEDNLTNQEVARGTLQRLGWSATVTSNGKEAVEALEKEPYDLVLMDVQMPEMDGYEATRVIRDSHSAVLNHNIPIIATTAHAMQGDIEKCLAAGMSDYISKPIDPKKLDKAVEMWLTRKVHLASGQVPDQQATFSHAPPSKPADKPAVFNRETFLQRMMGDEEFARDVVESFVKGLPALLSDLTEGFERKDLESIWKQAHKLKGSAANVGGDALRDVALKVETAGKAGDLEGAIRCIPELESNAGQLKEALWHWAN